MYASVQLGDLPELDFEHMTLEEIDNWEEFLDKEGEGCLLMVDLEYPLELHIEHNSFPLCPDHLNERLDAHLWELENYGIYYEGLKAALDFGLILKKIHCGIKFKEYAFAKPFIELNTKLCQQAKTKFEGNVFKLKMNSAFGKFGENKVNRSKVDFTKK